MLLAKLNYKTKLPYTLWSSWTKLPYTLCVSAADFLQRCRFSGSCKNICALLEKIYDFLELFAESSLTLSMCLFNPISYLSLLTLLSGLYLRYLVNSLLTLTLCPVDPEQSLRESGVVHLWLITGSVCFVSIPLQILTVLRLYLPSYIQKSSSFEIVFIVIDEMFASVMGEYVFLKW